MGYGRIAKVTVTSSDKSGIEVSELRIVFDITKTSKSESNSSKISIYNLNSDTAAFLEQKNLKVILFTGYENDQSGLSVIFKGEILNSTSSKIGTERLTILHCGDSDTAINLNQYQKSYRPGTKIRTIVTDIVNTMGVIVEDQNYSDIPSDSFISSYIAFGASKKILDDLIKKVGLEWYIQDGVFYAKKRIDIKRVNAIIINENTGLISSPERKNEKKTTSVDTESGVTFNSVLNPDLVPGQTVKIESEYSSTNTKGLFTIKEVKIQGDTHGKNWMCNCLCLGEKTSA